MQYAEVLSVALQQVFCRQVYGTHSEQLIYTDLVECL